jgi:hypothetical protein
MKAVAVAVLVAELVAIIYVTSGPLLLECAAALAPALVLVCGLIIGATLAVAFWRARRAQRARDDDTAYAPRPISRGGPR